MKRRNALRNLIVGMGSAMAFTQKGLALQNDAIMSQASTTASGVGAGKIHHSVCRWCYNDIPLEAFIDGVKSIEGMESIELMRENEWPLLKKNGLTCALGTASFASIENGFNDPANHEKLQKAYMGLIEKASEHGIPTIIVFSGNRRGMDDQVGMENCAKGLEPLAKHAEKHKVQIVMELLNSKVNHKDYMCDHTEWGVGLADKIGSPQFKLLYDIYHMQIMEGDVIATIKKYSDYIGHYHTGGVPGRHEIDETQELYYPAIIKAIVETGYTGYLGQEFIPTWDDKLKALAHGVKTCDV